MLNINDVATVYTEIYGDDSDTVPWNDLLEVQQQELIVLSREAVEDVWYETIGELYSLGLQQEAEMDPAICVVGTKPP